MIDLYHIVLIPKKCGEWILQTMNTQCFYMKIMQLTCIDNIESYGAFNHNIQAYIFMYIARHHCGTLTSFTTRAEPVCSLASIPIISVALAFMVLQ